MTCLSLSQMAVAGDTAATLAFRPASIQAEQQGVTPDQSVTTATPSAANLAFRPASEQTATGRALTGEAPSAIADATALAFRPASEQMTGLPAAIVAVKSGEQPSEVAAVGISSR